VHYSFKNMYCEEFHTYSHGVTVFLGGGLDPLEDMLVPRTDILKFCVTFCLCIFMFL
jgi:hypothetical protein